MAARLGVRLRGRLGGGLAARPWRAAPVVVFLVALAGTIAVLRVVLPVEPAGSAPADVYTRKLAFAQERLGEYEVVYIGSSRARRGFKPVVFEQALRARGIEVRALNLGIPGLGGFALEHAVERLLDRPTGALQLLVVAPDDFDVALAGPVAHTARAVAWHDAAGTARALGAVADRADGLAAVSWAWNHVDSFLLNWTATGRLASRFATRNSTPDVRIFGFRGDGYLAKPRKAIEARRYDRLITELRAVEAAPLEPPLAYERAYLERLRRLADARGVRLLVVREPTLSPRRTPKAIRDRTRFVRWVAERGGPVAALDLGNPLTRPELFERRLFFDPGHLNDVGATLYTTLLASEVVSSLAGDG
ncbi:MAG: hypothetical protein R3C15_13095 [Thermoleophilia bacterium]